MNEAHPLYEKIIEKLVFADQRTILPKAGLRMDRMLDLLADDGEKDTEIFKVRVKPEKSRPGGE